MDDANVVQHSQVPTVIGIYQDFYPSHNVVGWVFMVTDHLNINRLSIFFFLDLSIILVKISHANRYLNCYQYISILGYNTRL